MLTKTQKTERGDHYKTYTHLKHKLRNQVSKEVFADIMALAEHYLCYKEPISRHEILIEKAYRNAAKEFDLTKYLPKDEAKELRIELLRLDNINV